MTLLHRRARPARAILADQINCLKLLKVSSRKQTSLLHKKDSKEWSTKLQTINRNKKTIHLHLYIRQKNKKSAISLTMGQKIRDLSNHTKERVQLTASTATTRIHSSLRRMISFNTGLKQQTQIELCRELKKLMRRTRTAINWECQISERLRLPTEFSRQIKVLTLWKITQDISSKF